MRNFPWFLLAVSLLPPCAFAEDSAAGKKQEVPTVLLEGAWAGKFEIQIPGQPYSFGELENAQALGDFQALNTKKRRVLRFHLQHPVEDSLQEIIDLLRP